MSDLSIERFRRRGLETRGVRPDPLTRNRFARHVYETLERRWRHVHYMAVCHGVHEAFYGVPCGPALCQLPGRGPRGIIGDL